MAAKPVPLSRAGTRVQVSFEFFPPKSAEMEANLWEAATRLEPLNPAFVSVTYGAGGSTRERTHALLERLVRETTMKPAAHLTCVGASKDEIRATLRAYRGADVRHIVALRGDPPTGFDAPYEAAPDGYQSTADLVAGVPAVVSIQVEKPSANQRSLSVTVHLDVSRLPFSTQNDRKTQRITFVTALLDSQGKMVAAKQGRIVLVATFPDSVTFQPNSLVLARSRYS